MIERFSLSRATTPKSDRAHKGETSKATAAAAAAAAKLRRVQRSNVIFKEECGGEELDVREGGAPMAARKKKEHNAM